MPNATHQGSLEKTVSRDESRISDRLAELSELTRSAGYVHTARMIDEALSAYSFERRQAETAKRLRSELQQLKRIEASRSYDETDRKPHLVPNFRSRRSAKPDGMLFDGAERSDGAAQKAGARNGQAAFVLTTRMRVDGRNVARLRNGHWTGISMSFPAEPEFQFR
ncbi:MULTISPECIES: hypothetical protein [unclassified Ruegeria]|uniref:hypothetical protein n=1 Tax=unclassified Ruegeria TaxID=2625375 RepID=UPI001AEB2255|nr:MULTISPECIES: hypothetical protein [unclassified Ruegeria]